MKIGEIAVVGPTDIDKRSFLSTVCTEIHPTGGAVVFGRVPVGDNLLLHIYGIDVSARPERYEWDMISTHLAGCIIPYHWFVRRSFETAQVIIDFLYSKYDVPFVIAADTGSRPIPAPSLFHTSGISLSGDSKFVFWRADHAKSIRRMYTTLFDSLIDRAAQTYD